MHRLDKIIYYNLAMATHILKYLGIRNKNSWIFQKKREYLLKVVPDAKLIAEASGAAHVYLHPKKESRDMSSIREFLSQLVQECKNRNLDNETIRWAESMLKKEYVQRGNENFNWKPNLEELKKIKKIVTKRTTNRYTRTEKFDKRIIYELIKLAVQAPSSCNKQGWRFIIYEDRKIINKIAEIKNQKFLSQFPYIIACCFDKDAYMGTDIKMTPYLDCGAALMNLSNAAAAVGLACCWCNFSQANIGIMRHNMFIQAVKLPKSLLPVSFVALGIPAKKIEKPPRENLNFYLPFENELK